MLRNRSQCAGSATTLDMSNYEDDGGPYGNLTGQGNEGTAHTIYYDNCANGTHIGLVAYEICGHNPFYRPEFRVRTRSFALDWMMQFTKEKLPVFPSRKENVFVPHCIGWKHRRRGTNR